MESNLTPRTSDVLDVDRSLLKIAIVISVCVLLAFLTSFFLEKNNLIVAVVFLVLFLSTFTIQNLFVKGLDKLFLAALLSSGAMTAPFYYNFSGYSAIAMSILAVLLFKSSLDSRSELRDAIKIKFFRISRFSLNLSVPAIILFFGLMIFLRGEGFTENSVRLLLHPISPVVERYIPTFEPDIKTKDLLNDIVVSNFSPQDTENLNALPLLEQNQVVEEGVGQLQNRIETYVGSKIDLEKSVVGNIYDSALSAYESLTSGSRSVLLVISLFVAYSLLRSLVPILQIPIALLTLVLYEILLATNFAVVGLEQRSREVITLK